MPQKEIQKYEINNQPLQVESAIRDGNGAIISDTYGKLYEASNIEALGDSLINALKVGDVVQKITGNQKHCYIVTYKQENHGICLSYFDAGYLETVSYDYTDGHWVFNSKDVCEVASKNSTLPVSSLTGSELVEELEEKTLYYYNGEYYFITGIGVDAITFIYIATDGTMASVGYSDYDSEINFATIVDDADYNYYATEQYVNNVVGTKLYKHNFTITDDDLDTYDIEIISTNNVPFTLSSLSARYMLSGYVVNSSASMFVGANILNIAKVGGDTYILLPNKENFPTLGNITCYTITNDTVTEL